eukprot:4559692-Pyramimonas_sp.AAC.1
MCIRDSFWAHHDPLGFARIPQDTSGLLRIPEDSFRIPQDPPRLPKESYVLLLRIHDDSSGFPNVPQDA